MENKSKSLENVVMENNFISLEDVVMENNVKKNYETPEAEKIMFDYRDQVVAASQGCQDVWVNIGVSSCTEGNKHLEHLN